MTVVDADAVQPFAGSVAVTEYVPAVLTVLVAVVVPAPQSYVAPVVVEDAVKVTLVTEQVKSAGVAIVILGIITF